MAPFCSCPASLVSKNFLLSAPGVQSVLFVLRSVGRRDLSAGQSKKKHHPGCFFLLRPRGKAGKGEAPCRHGASPCPAFPRGRSTKKTPWVVFLFLLRPRADAHSLTAGLGGDASPSPGWCFFFCCGPARTGLVFFFCCGPARTLTHSLWAGAISARPGWCFFFCCGPAGSF